jgi:Reverse transcriptase (RNA-dependent DNA polymerase)
MDPERSMLIHAGLQESLWPLAVKNFVVVRNRVPHIATKSTPFELLTGARPSLKNIRVFGCAAFVLRMPQSSKLQPRADEGTLLECGEYGTYKVLVCSDDAASHIVESRYVTFVESSFPGANCLSNHMLDEDLDDSDHASISGESSACESRVASECDDQVSINSYQHKAHDASLVQEVDHVMCDENVDPGVLPAQLSSNASVTSEHEDSDEDGEDFDINEEGYAELDSEQAPAADTGRYSQRKRRLPPAWMMDAYSPTTQTNFDVTTSDEPTLREAMKASPQVQALWLQAIEEEFDALDCKGTWVPNLKSHKQALPTRVILKVKRNADGLVERFKARIVSGGNHQQICQDYFEKYTPVVDFAIVRVFLYITVCSNMRMAQVDVKTAFLNGELDDDSWVMSPRGVPVYSASRYKLRKALYRLKQAHKAWHVKLVSDLCRLGVVELASAPCVFMLKTDEGAVYIMVYVDDLIILAPADELLSSLLKSLHRLYELR